jgi:ADP-heptose:LPS heptosyltransferase
MTIKTKQKIDYYIGGVFIFVLRPLVYIVGKLVSRNHELQIHKKAVFLKFQGGGSLVLALPSLLALKARFPKAKMILVTLPSVREFGAALHFFDEIIVIQDNLSPRLITSGFFAWLKCLGADTVIDLEVYSRISTIYSLATLARNRVGFYLETNFWRKYINTHLIYFNRYAGVYFFYEQIAKLFGAEALSAQETRSYLCSQLKISSHIQNDSEKQIAIGHACSGFGQERRLNEQEWKLFLSKRLSASSKGRVMFLGGPSDFASASKIISHVSPDFPQIQFENFCGRYGLEDSLRKLAEAHEFWGVDSGLLHFARLLGISSVSIWGPTDPSTRLKPIPNYKEEILYEKISCSPCIHVADTPPCDGNNQCIKRLFVKNSNEKPENDLFTVWPSTFRKKSS